MVGVWGGWAWARPLLSAANLWTLTTATVATFASLGLRVGAVTRSSAYYRVLIVLSVACILVQLLLQLLLYEMERTKAAEAS
jgi:hypothetical protein